MDRGGVGSGSSHGNCGLICPSHVLPLAEPGMVMKGIKSLFASNSPFAIKPRLDPALWSWLLHFAARCNERDMLAAGGGIQALLNSSLPLYRELIEHEGLDCEFDRGLLLRLPVETGDGSLHRDRPADDRSVRLPRPTVRRQRARGARARALSRAWPAAGTITTTPTCAPTSSCAPGANRSRPAGLSIHEKLSASRPSSNQRLTEFRPPHAARRAGRGLVRGRRRAPGRPS